MNWYYELHGERHGPVSIGELSALIENGSITVDNLVWRKGMSDWASLRHAGVLTSDDGEELGICAHSGKIMEKSKLVPYGDQFISPDYREEFVQELMEGGDSVGTEDGLIPNDYSVDIGACYRRAWELFSADFWPVLGISLLIFICLGAASQVGASIILNMPLMAGLFYYYLKKMRAQPAGLEDSFKGFKIQVGQLMLMNLVLVGVQMVAIVFLFVPMSLLMPLLEGSGDEAGVTFLIVMVTVMAIVVIGLSYLQLTFSFAPLLCIDKRIGFWDAIKISFKTYHKHWFLCTMFFFLSGLVVLLGFAALCVGALVAMPWMWIAQAYLYEDIFGGKRAAGQALG